jgi:cell division protease FtsH
MSQGQDYSEETAALIDRSVQLMLRQAHENVRALLSSHRSQLDDLTKALLEHEVIELAELQAILGDPGGRPLGTARAIMQ